MNNSRSKSWSTIALAAALLSFAAGCGGGQNHGRSGANAAAAPPQLKSIRQLQSVFNSASDEPTLVVLIAPT